MSEGSYKQFCPVAMASEILCSRWTLIILRELMCGSTRFNELRRGMPRISPALLSKRLKELEAAGIVAREPVRGEADVFAYRLTKSGKELIPIVEAVGAWGHRWIETKASLENLDISLLMWDIRRNIDPSPMPKRRNVIEIIFTDQPVLRRNWWVVIEPDAEPDLCSIDPGFDVDLYLSTDLKTMTEIWMGYTTLARAKSSGRMTITGNRQLAAAVPAWLTLSRFAKIEKLVA